ncbi:MAG: hypothetical protein HDR03_05425 [Lachnospiraceae bacterium]|nr:hypothetical protein [Lachnospiraceae bacterium]
MNKNNATVAEKNRELDKYLEEENYEKVDEISRELCRLQGLDPAEEMPSDFLFQLKKKEKKEMNNVKKISKNFTRVAAVAAGFLLIGGIASAAEKYYTNTVITVYNSGDSSGDYTVMTNDGNYSVVTYEGSYMFPEETITNVIEQEYGDSDQAWLEKKVMDEIYSAYKSDENSNWIPYEVSERITEYKYEKYNDAVKDVKFVNAFNKDYSGTTYYRERQPIIEGNETSYDNIDITNYSISADLEYGKNTFAVEQIKMQKYVDVSAEVASSVTYSTGGEINNERTYKSTSGYDYVLADNSESGENVTVVTISGDEYELVLTFTGMSDDDIYDVLESVNIRELVEF